MSKVRVSVCLNIGQKKGCPGDARCGGTSAPIVVPLETEAILAAAANKLKLKKKQVDVARLYVAADDGAGVYLVASSRAPADGARAYRKLRPGAALAPAALGAAAPLVHADARAAPGVRSARGDDPRGAPTAA